MHSRTAIQFHLTLHRPETLPLPLPILAEDGQPDHPALLILLPGLGFAIPVGFGLQGQSQLQLVGLQGLGQGLTGMGGVYFAQVVLSVGLAESGVEAGGRGWGC